jgi:hypothetical protein
MRQCVFVHFGADAAADCHPKPGLTVYTTRSGLTPCNPSQADRPSSGSCCNAALCNPDMLPTEKYTNPLSEVS